MKNAPQLSLFECVATGGSADGKTQKPEIKKLPFVSLNRLQENPRDMNSEQTLSSIIKPGDGGALSAVQSRFHSGISTAS